jgi:hypothetical protein
MLRRHFGLGTAPTVELLEVRWPSGIVDRLRNVAANQRVTIVESAAAAGAAPAGRRALDGASFRAVQRRPQVAAGSTP